VSVGALDPSSQRLTASCVTPKLAPMLDNVSPRSRRAFRLSANCIGVSTGRVAQLNHAEPTIGVYRRLRFTPHSRVISRPWLSALLLAFASVTPKSGLSPAATCEGSLPCMGKVSHTQQAIATTMH
jgi:hypothetical protein